MFNVRRNCQPFVAVLRKGSSLREVPDLLCFPLPRKAVSDHDKRRRAKQRVLHKGRATPQPTANTKTQDVLKVWQHPKETSEFLKMNLSTHSVLELYLGNVS